MAGRVNVIPPVRCAARSKRTKKPCRDWAIPGLTVCRHHGGGAHRDKAVQRLTLATLLASDPRPVWTVLLDAVHTADALARDARLRLGDGEEPTVRQVESVVDTAKLAAHFSKIALDTGAANKIADALQRNVELEGRLVAEVLGRLLDALLTGLAELALPPDRARALRAWAFDSARTLLSTLDPEADVDARVDVPPPPLGGLTLVLVNRPQLAPAASSETSSAARRWPPAGRQRTRAADASAARPVPADRTPAPADDHEPLDADVIDGEVVDPRYALSARLLAVRRTRAELAALTGLTLSAVWRAQNGKAHDEELSTWERALATLASDVDDYASTSDAECGS